MRREDLDHAVQLQNGNPIGELRLYVLEPNGQLVLTLKDLYQGSIQSDVHEIFAQLNRIEHRLAGRR